MLLGLLLILFYLQGEGGGLKPTHLVRVSQKATHTHRRVSARRLALPPHTPPPRTGPPGAAFLMAGLAIIGSTAAIGGWQLVIGSVRGVGGGGGGLETNSTAANTTPDSSRCTPR